MTVIARFNDLNNRDSSREEIESLLVDAKAENNTEIVFRLSKVLNTFPEKDLFRLTIKEYKVPRLNGAKYTGDFKEALNDCGRLKKGYKFHFGKIIKTEAKVRSEVITKKIPVTPTASVKKPVAHKKAPTKNIAPVKAKKVAAKIVEKPTEETPVKAKKEIKKPVPSDKKTNETGLGKTKPVVKEHNKSLSDLEKMGFVSADFVPEKANNIYMLGGDIGKFLQNQQPHKSLILIKGNKHSSKSQLAMQIANAYAEEGKPVAYIDYEQGGTESKDTVDSVNRNTSEKGRKNIAIKGYLEKPFEELQSFCKVCDVIVADSVTDLKITADQLNELRNKYVKITWIFISQVKENGAQSHGYN